MNNTKTFQKKLMPLMVSLIAAGSSSFAFAQDDSVEEIVVSGYRESLAKALDIKRKDTTQVDAIVAEDIGKFPDMNLAESLQRVSGVSIDRSGGEGRQISVRGLGSDFTRVRLNGMEALSTAGQGSSGPNRSRGFDFQTFASELFSEVKVSKTQNAAMDEGSLGSTVDLRAGRPFDYKGFAATASVQGTYNELTEKANPRISALITDQNEDGTFGGLLSASYSERNIVEQGFNPIRFDWGNGSGTGGNANTGGTVTSTANPNAMYGFCTPVGYTGVQVPRNPLAAELGSATNLARNNGYGTFGIDANNCATGVPRPANTAANIAAYETATNSWMPRYPGWRSTTHDLERVGMTGSLQWKPAETTLINFDVLYSKYHKDSREDTLGANLHRAVNIGGKAQIVVKKAEVGDKNRLVYAELDNVDFRTESAQIEESTEFAQYSLGLNHDFNDSWHLDASIGTSSSSFEMPKNSLVSFDNTNLDGFIWDARESIKSPKMTYPFDLSSTAAWKWLGYGSVPLNTNGNPKGVNISEIRINPQAVDNSFDTGKIDLTYTLNDSVKISGGLAHKDYLMESQEWRHINYGLAASALPAGTTVADVSQMLTGYGKGLSGAPSSWLVPNFDKVAELMGIYGNENTGVPGGNYTVADIGHFGASGNNYSVQEKSSSAYLQVDFTVPFLGRDLRGNLGTRYTKTDITSNGYTPCAATPAIAATGTTPAVAAKVAGDNNCAGSEEFYGVASASATPGARFYVPVEATNEYDDWLPSLNLAWDLTDDVVLRFAAAKTMARPNLNTLSPTISGVPTTYTTDEALYGINAGNPNVEPYRADTYDLGAEWYFDEGAMLSGAVFYKDIKSYIQRVRQVQTWDQTGWPVGLLPTGFDGNETFNIQSYFNTPGGPLKGYELSFQQPFKFLPGIWQHFGVQANYTHVESKIDYVQASSVNSTTRAVTTTYTKNNLVNMSPSSYNATFYYDDGKFSARISAAFRDRYLTAILIPEAGVYLASAGGATVYTADVTGKQATTNVDFNMSYNLNDQITLTFAAINLTDQFDDVYGDSTIMATNKYTHTGREYTLGARYKF